MNPPKTSVDWIQTFSGRIFHPTDPRPEEIDLADIAHSLSLQCRFNGHCRIFYSVAEHSVRVSNLLAPEHALWGLLHDAGEAYLTDLPRPVKNQVSDYRDLEDHLLQKVAERFALPWPIPSPVHEADDRMLMTEARDLMAPPPASWGIDTTPDPTPIEPWTAQEAERIFLERFEALSGQG